MVIKKFVLGVLLGIISNTFIFSEEPTVYHIPIEGQINQAQLYILRRGLKDALDSGVQTVVLEIDTPGGRLDTTLEMMEALNKFTGTTYTFVNTEAISAGAYISAVTDEIFFHPQGVLGAAAVIQGTGAEVPETLKEKINSYLRARVRSYTDEHRYRSDVIRAMMDEDYELKIDDKVIKEEGELLTITAKEAVNTYGNPPEPLFGAGIYEDLESLLKAQLGEDYVLKKFELTWSEELARWLNSISQILLGAGLMLLFIEFKTPGFGIFGFAGISVLLVVFASSYVAGLAGYEEILVFLIGVILVAIELFIFPGLLFPGIIGTIMVLGSIVWALTDVWPVEGYEVDVDSLIGAVSDLVIGLIIALGGTILVGRYLLKGWIYQNLVLESTVGEPDEQDVPTHPIAGDEGIAVTDLHPTGEIEVNGRRYEAKTQFGEIATGQKVTIVKVEDFYYVVK